ncbi:hypothetical protein AAVH_08085 [Aphelenchoides avenae]|nr:hypothetical protein AAVH_08085 [Aphelenchus avenae]
MSSSDLRELRKQFGPLGKSLTLSSAYSLYEQFCSLDDGYAEEMEELQADVHGAARFGFVNGKLTKRDSFSGFASLTVLAAEVRNPKGSPKLELTSSAKPFLALVAIKKAEDDLECHLLLVGDTGEGPSDVIPLTGTTSFITVVALPFTADGLSCVLHDLIALLEAKASSDAPIQEDLGRLDVRQDSLEEAAAKHRRKRLEKEDRRARARRAKEAAHRREQWQRTLTRLLWRSPTFE